MHVDALVSTRSNNECCCGCCVDACDDNKADCFCSLDDRDGGDGSNVREVNDGTEESIKADPVVGRVEGSSELSRGDLDDDGDEEVGNEGGVVVLVRT
jgi:hypothetical protein